MSNLAEKVEAVQRLATSYQAVLDLAAELGGIASIDAHRQEVEARRDAAQADLVVISGKCDEARRVAAEVEAQSLADAARAQEHADGVRLDAQERAARVMDAAQKDADDLINSARAAAERVKASAQASANELRESVQKERDRLEGENALASATVAELQVQGDAARAELGELNAKISQARAAIDNFTAIAT